MDTAVTQSLTARLQHNSDGERGNPFDKFLNNARKSPRDVPLRPDDILESVIHALATPTPWMSKLCDLNYTANSNDQFIANILLYYEKHKPWAIDDTKLQRLRAAANDLSA